MKVNQNELKKLQQEPVLSKYEFRKYEEYKHRIKKIRIEKLNTVLDTNMTFYKLISRD